MRRALHRLRSRGEAVPEPERREVVATLPAVDEDLGAALISVLDPAGARMAYLVEANPAGGARLFAVALDELLGVTEVEVFSAGRSKIRKFMGEFARRDDFPAVEVPPDAVRALIARTASRQASDRPLPRGFSEWRARIAEPPEGAATPGELAREALGSEVGDASEELRRAEALLRDRVLGPWPPDRAALHEIAQRLSEASAGVVIVSGGARQAQIDSVLDDAVEQLYAGDVGERTACRFDESAYVFWKREQPREARACLTAASAFRSGDSAHRKLARAMLDIVFAPLLRSVEQEPDEPDAAVESMLVRP